MKDYMMDDVRLTVPVSTDKNQSIPSSLFYPHYSDRRFDRPQTIFLAPGTETTDCHGVQLVPGVNYLDSDRFQSFFAEEALQAAAEAAENQKLAKNSPAWVEAELRELYKNHKLELVHISAGVKKMSNGNPYRSYGFITNT